MPGCADSGVDASIQLLDRDLWLHLPAPEGLETVTKAA